MNAKYEFLEIIGEGSYGIVYKCKDKSTGEIVAIKRYKETDDPLVKKIISRELRILQMIKHENIVEYKECFKRKGSLYVVFEYLEKNVLQVLQEEGKGLEENAIKSIIYQLCKAIYYLNTKNIIHRDIKPENLLIDKREDGSYILKLCDFGFARRYSNFVTVKETLTDYVATRWYRAPELIVAKGEYNYEVDYWAIGCIMAELGEGEALFPGNNDLDQLMVIRKVLGGYPEGYFEGFQKLSNFINFDKLKNVDQNLDVTDQNEKKVENLEEKNENPEENNYNPHNEPTASASTLNERFNNLLSPLGLDFLSQLLQIESNKRLKGINTLTHPYLEDLYKKDDQAQNIFNEENIRVENVFDPNELLNIKTFQKDKENVESDKHDKHDRYDKYDNYDTCQTENFKVDKLVLQKFKNFIPPNLSQNNPSNSGQKSKPPYQNISNLKKSEILTKNLEKEFVISPSIQKHFKNLLTHKKSSNFTIKSPGNYSKSFNNKVDFHKRNSADNITQNDKKAEKFYTNTLFKKEKSNVNIQNVKGENLRDQINFYYEQEKQNYLKNENLFSFKTRLPSIKILSSTSKK